MRYILAVDQGTTSSRAIVFNEKAEPVASHQLKFEQHFPHPGWVEHDPEDIWQTTLICCREAVNQAGSDFNQIAGIGITNQRETTVIWDRETGKPIYNAIVWQDRRTAKYCDALKQAGHEENIQEKTGLLLDPYFSGSKIAWLLDHVPAARAKAENAELAFGTIDSFLLWRFTGGKVHATDASNASRTLLFNIKSQDWDKSCLALFKIPQSLLPEVKDNCAEFGKTDTTLFGHAVPILAMAGDQQAALIGQTCFQPGMVKSTFGTGAFLLLNIGDKPIKSSQRLLTTVAYRLAGKTSYAFEGSIFAAGTTIQWLRDQLGLIKHARETESIAANLTDTNGVYLVPAFTGLGAPHWNPHAKAAIVGLTRDSSKEHIVRAGLEAITYQTRDLVDAMSREGGIELSELRVDGGMVANNWLLQFLADMLNVPVVRPNVIETTALGVALLAGLGAGIYASIKDIEKVWQEDQRFLPAMPPEQRAAYYQGWARALQQVE